MENQVEKFDPSKLMDGVRDRIKATFVSLIPDDQWEIMVKKEVDKFFKEINTSYNQRIETTDFARLVNEVVVTECRQRLKEYLSTHEFNSVWQTNGIPTTSEKVKEILVENSGLVFANMIGGMMSQMLTDFRNNININTRGY